MTMEEVVYKIFQSHAEGIKFREWKAGWGLDSNMDGRGFNLEL